jgi:hypothetical protein
MIDPTNPYGGRRRKPRARREPMLRESTPQPGEQRSVRRHGASAPVAGDTDTGWARPFSAAYTGPSKR